MSKYVAITGSSTGIGSSTVSKYLKEGYIVFGLDINKPEVTHNNFFHINCDISSVSSIKKARLEVDSFTKKVDHLVSNAGVHSFGSLKDLTEEKRKRRYLGRYFAHPMMQNRRAKRDDYKPSAVRVTQRCVP
ncbi:SDR family NAD(P)-dependent oxidoreductase [Piscirickettsia salmonis]|uniref:SDR family NAD(P)-dependent oxidoreductase n=1 Tax=Piscirickettsia salmonis TaxID=1238 RepID=UPI0012BA70C6|nr:SDR family NAD(P)-dependent oxidoreductase [Piscirickettsia salmonis]QGP41214.1 3-oxoacyl-[acyl-carrier-protein] reductase FabG1 [Piscirickettsia salmonis]